MSNNTRTRTAADQHQYPAAESVAHLSETAYHQRIDTLVKRILPRLADETGALRSVNYNKILGHLKVIERMSFDNPFSVLKHSEYDLDAFDWERINGKPPVHGLTEQARRLIAGDVQRRLLELVANSNEMHDSSDASGNRSDHSLGSA